MGFDLQIYNPSDYPRSGFVTIPWQRIANQTGMGPEELVLHGPFGGDPLPAQVDDIDPADPALKTLVFTLDHQVDPGPDDYSKPSSSVMIDRGKPAANDFPALEIERAENKSAIVVALSNNKLRVGFSLAPKPAADLGDWFAGSAPVVQLYGDEMLDLFRAPFPELHDRQKRCMQIDQIQIWNPAWEVSLYRQIPFFQTPYELVSECVGPVRNSITVASEPFEYDYVDPYVNDRRSLVCRLYRIISLYADADYVIEELFVKAKPDNGADDSNTFLLNFIGRYFCYMDMGFMPEIYRFPNIPDWFALGQPKGSLYEPHPGYGFATDVHTGPIAHPHPGFHDPETAYKSFSWELMPARRAKCLHLFMQGEPGGFDSRIGHNWYEHIYKPLRAELSELA
jgi:hypothetical protein